MNTACPASDSFFSNRDAMVDLPEPDSPVIQKTAGRVWVTRSRSSAATEDRYGVRWLSDIVNPSFVNEKYVYGYIIDETAGYVNGSWKISAEKDKNSRIHVILLHLEGTDL